jgi:hypothetical protein
VGTFLNRRHLARLVLATSLALGIAAAGVGYLGSSLSIPGPANAASVEQMRERGAEVYVKFCEVPKFEPRFWPECKNTAADWRARGADRLVAFCRQGVPSRMFGAEDCQSPDRAAVALTRAPGWGDAALGGAVAAAALVILGLLAASVRAAGPRHSPSPG